MKKEDLEKLERGLKTAKKEFGTYDIDYEKNKIFRKGMDMIQSVSLDYYKEAGRLVNMKEKFLSHEEIVQLILSDPINWSQCMFNNEVLDIVFPEARSLQRDVAKKGEEYEQETYNMRRYELIDSLFKSEWQEKFQEEKKMREVK